MWCGCGCIFRIWKRDRPAFLAARQEFFTGNFPCSTLVEVSALVSPEMLVEVDADAIIGAGAA